MPILFIDFKIEERLYCDFKISRNFDEYLRSFLNSASIKFRLFFKRDIVDVSIALIFLLAPIAIKISNISSFLFERLIFFLNPILLPLIKKFP